MNDRQDSKDLDVLRKELFIKEELISHQQAQLKSIYGMKSWRLALALARLNGRIFLYARRLFRFFGLVFLFIYTLLIAGYLYALKKIRNIIIFPGG